MIEEDVSDNVICNCYLRLQKFQTFAMNPVVSNAFNSKATRRRHLHLLPIIKMINQSILTTKFNSNIISLFSEIQ